MPRLALCLYGLAGSGKSTVARAVEAAVTARGYTAATVKLAEPLYQLQTYMYRAAGLSTDVKDNELLRVAAAQYRRINPHFLANDFLARVAASTADVVLNDDLRDADIDYPGLIGAGFRFVRVDCDDAVRQERLRARGDVTVVPDSASTWGHDRITPDYVIDNTAGDPGEAIDVVVHKWLADATD